VHPELIARQKTTASTALWGTLDSQLTGLFEGILGNDVIGRFSMMEQQDIIYNDGRTTLPLPPKNDDEHKFEMDIYVRFMRHLRHVPNSRTDIKILSSIQFTADMLDTSDALVAKTLVDMGLRAPRKAFPITFLDFADKCAQRLSWELNTPPASVVALTEHWACIGEDVFSLHAHREYTTYNDAVHV
jgi:hypothetical protein